MRTAYCPTSHEELASKSAGKAYGHVPGHQYHDVDVVVSRRGEKYRCHVVESWGSAQGYDEEHGRREAIGRGKSVREAVDDGRVRATAAGMINIEYLEQALSLAEDAAEEAAMPERANWIRVVEMENVSCRNRRQADYATEATSLADVAMALDEAEQRDIDQRGASGMGAGAFLEAMVVAEDEDEDEAPGETVESVDDPLFAGLPLGNAAELREFIGRQKGATCWDGNNHVPAPYRHSEALLNRICGR